MAETEDRMSAIVICLLVLMNLGEWEALQCKGKTVTGQYVNYALGFSLKIPKQLHGKRGQASGPERGVSIPLESDCSSVIAVYGEPNSLEWTNPEDAIAWELQQSGKPATGIIRYATYIGKLKAAGLVLQDQRASRVEMVVIAFEPDSGLVYTARLVTTKTREKQDRDILDRVLRSFRIEPWR